MDDYVLEVYLDDVNRDYLNKLTFLTLFKSRSLGYRCAADMFCEAYREYRENISEESIKTLLTYHTSKYITSNYDVEYKDDLVYLIRHPSALRYKEDPKQKPVRKKVLRFFEVEEKGNEYKREAFDYLEKMRPVKRAAQVDRILEQYLTLNCNEYYVAQAAARIIDDLVDKAEFDDEGKILSPAKEIVETIWCIGKNL